ncbi:L,D-transpeptidase [Yinghuangia seranimata]|uniref:L,D-transpeptidase n=1 Tax=Yinghuangia seranimata TaxID=408067 RepID=UPI00248C86EF|nr:Ig-like domain-containing protein [Yinghuangia seranimata]MDI2130299.1 Ig-like domain-containing protein [Yinghuangia seranimata]
MRRTTVTVLAALAVFSAACTGGGGGKSDDGKARPADGSVVSGAPVGAPASPGSPAAPAAALTVTPADGAKLTLGQPVTVAVTGGRIGGVTVTADDGSAVPGETAQDGSQWHSTAALHVGTTYSVVATATNATGQETRQTSKFSTPAADKKLTWQVNVSNGHQYGVGMPISVTFDQPVTDRAAVERALTVTTEPKVEGSWSWVKDRNLNDGQRIDFRPRDYWQPGTKVTVKAALNGVPTGGGRFGARDAEVSFTIARHLVATVDLKTHEMTVDDGKTPVKIPVTGGAPATPTWGGTMVVMDKDPHLLMDSRTVGFADAYHDYYDWAVHLTTSGTYLHENHRADTEAGHNNVTHGCVGLATDGTAQSFYNRVIPGDVVIVKNTTEKTVATGNGYGDWNPDWTAWQAGSALK